MTKLEQRCNEVQKALKEFNVKYVYQWDTKTNIKICKTKYSITIINRYITVSYKKKQCYIFLPSFTGITEFREFIQENGTNFMKLIEVKK